MMNKNDTDFYYHDNDIDVKDSKELWNALNNNNNNINHIHIIMQIIWTWLYD